MSALKAPEFVTVDEYLRTSYPDGDREYVDGVIVERNLGTYWHSRLQAILVGHFLQYGKKLPIQVLPECRTRVSQTRFRVPDVVLIRSGHRPDKFIDEAPLVVIEILSPDDRVNATLQRFADYQQLGVAHILQMDPVERVIHVYRDGSLALQDVQDFALVGGSVVPFPGAELLAQLDD